MAKKFDIGDFAKTLAQPVPESDTGREQIEYISVDLLDDDPNNFFLTGTRRSPTRSSLG